MLLPALFLALAPFFVSCRGRVNSLPGVNAHGVATNVWPDLSDRLPRGLLDRFTREVSNAAPAEIRPRVLAAFGQFRAQGDLERGYWTLLAYKYWHQAIDASNFARAWGPLDASGAPAILNRLLCEQAERLAERSLSDAFGLLAGLGQFGLDGESADRVEEWRDRLYWRDERRAIRALLATNAVDRWLLPPFGELRQKTYQLPVAPLDALYLYERGGVDWNAFKARRIEALQRLQAGFPRADWWIFTNTRFPDLNHRPGNP